MLATSGILAMAGWQFAVAGDEDLRGVDRLYILNCGESHTHDLSNWSPGVNVGVPWDFSNHCYLIKHAKGYLLWDTGMSDSIAARPDGLEVGGGLLTLKVRQTLVSQLQELGLSAGDIRHLALSHFHGDHAGNANLFSAARLYIQKTEFDAAFGDAPAQYGFSPILYENLRGSVMTLLDGDHDVFGDGSVIILSTPGHTPGHQSLAVRLRTAGLLVLSGDVAHFEENWARRRVPKRNFDREQSIKSMDRIAAFLAANKARLLINHDAAREGDFPLAPAYLE
jgi:glyoxylase-like metal-dependent hydrolase (beta-lactamase superfamily II)